LANAQDKSSLPQSVGVAVITYRACEHLTHCLPPYLNSPLKPKVLVVNSSSNDGTVELAERLGAETMVVPREEFNHGATREAARNALGTDIVVMTTPDAYALDTDVLTRLVEPIEAGKAAASYARQVPRDGAGFLEAFPRSFNYPAEGNIRSKADMAEHGIYTIFCSDACAAYNNRALESIGGFQTVLTMEDTLAAALLIEAGFSVAYVAGAVVKHSHCYSLHQEFSRYFDIGLERAEKRELYARFGKDESRGVRFVKAMLASLARHAPHKIPFALLQTAAKFFGYRLGRMCNRMPKYVLRALSSQDFYWNSRHADLFGRASIRS